MTDQNKKKLQEAMDKVWKNHKLKDGPEILILLDACKSLLSGDYILKSEVLPYFSSNPKENPLLKKSGECFASENLEEIKWCMEQLGASPLNTPLMTDGKHHFENKSLVDLNVMKRTIMCLAKCRDALSFIPRQLATEEEISKMLKTPIIDVIAERVIGVDKSTETVFKGNCKEIIKDLREVCAKSLVGKIPRQVVTRPSKWFNNPLSECPYCFGRDKDCKHCKTKIGSEEAMICQILKNEGLEDWNIKWNTGGGLCVYAHKEIWIGERGNSMALFLHEVAHALCPKEKCGECWVETNNGHNAIWGDTFTALVKKYLTHIPRQDECPHCKGLSMSEVPIVGYVMAQAKSHDKL
jgi:hypothetical protein